MFHDANNDVTRVDCGRLVPSQENAEQGLIQARLSLLWNLCYRIDCSREPLKMLDILTMQ
eukprot:scaffold77331_cov72-Attheya_sp.AAC.1